MLRKTKVSLLLCLLSAALLSSPGAAAQGTNVGTASGQVKRCNVTGNGQKEERSAPLVKVCAFWEDAWKPGLKCDKACKRPTCQMEQTGPDGFFTISELNVGSWVFVAVKGKSALRGGIVKGNIFTVGTNPVNDTPPPLWLTPTNCPELLVSNPGVNPTARGDVAASPPGRGGAGADILLVLYDNGQSRRAPATASDEAVTLKGKVVDAESRPLNKAMVFITAFSEDESVDLSTLPNTETGADGTFTLTLPKKWKGGGYIFSVTMKGFRPLIITLEQAVAKFTPKLTVTTLGAPGPEEVNYAVLPRREALESRPEVLIEKFDATRRRVFQPDVMQTLPVQGTRNFDEFALLAPGVLPPPETFGGVGPGVSAGVGTAGQFAINGLRSRENNFTVDGSDNNDEDIGTRRQGFIITVPQPVESVQELQVITALGDARFGRNIGGQVNALTKTGGLGDLHGSLYVYVTDHRLNARSPFDQSAADAPAAFTPLRQSDGARMLLDGAPLVRRSQVGGENQFTRLQLGLTVGGQVTDDNDTSYFISAERQDVRASAESHFAVPTVRQRGAFGSGETGLLLADGPNARAPVYPASVPGNAVFSLFPFPNNPRGPYGENTYSTVLPADGHGTRLSVKLDRQFGGEPRDGRWWKKLFTGAAHVDQVTGRYNFTDELSTLPVTGGALFSSLRPKVRTFNLSGFVNRSISPSTGDTIRISVGHTHLSFDERRDASLLPSSAMPGTQFLLNAPLLLNVTRPNADGTLNAPSFVSAVGPAGSSLLGSLGYRGVTQTEQITGPLGQIMVAGFSPVGVDTENFPQSRANTTFQFADTIASVKGPHVFTFGVDVRKPRINSTLDRNFRPRVVFNGLPGASFANTVELPSAGPAQGGTLTGATLAAAGVPTGLFQVLSTVSNSSVSLRYTQANLFFQDQWRVLPSLHLTAGLRYELNTVPDTASRRLEAAFDAEELRSLAEQAARSCQPNARCADLASALAAAFPTDFKASFGTDRNDFDLRLGFAWAPTKLRDTSIRGGFATYSGQFPGIVLDQTRNAFPDFLPLNLANFTPRSGDRTYLFNLASPAVGELLPRSGGVTPGTLNQIQAVNPVAFLVNQIFNLQNLSLASTLFGLDLVLPRSGLKPPYAYHYGLTVEHQFKKNYMVSVAYVGTRGIGLLRVTTPDRGLNGGSFAGDITVNPLTAAEPFPFFQGKIRPPQSDLISQSFAIAHTFYESSAQSSYNSLQAEFRKRYSNAFLVGSAFTYSHSIDDASDFFDNAGAFALPQNSIRSSERASSNFDVRVRSATHFVVDLQKEWFGYKRWAGTKKEWFGRVLGGFQLAGIFTAQGGQPYTVNSALDVNRDGNLTDRLDTYAGIIRDPARGPVQLHLAPGVSTQDLLAPDGSDGSIGRNTFRAPHLYTMDFSVTEAIPFREHSRFLVRVEFFNLFNWANYGIPVRILESPGFGTSVRTLTPPRTIQLVGKFQF